MAEFSLNGTGAFSHYFFQLVSCALEVLLHFFEQAAKFTEFGFYRSQNSPYFSRPFLDGECAEAHLQAVEDGTQSGRTGNYYFILFCSISTSAVRRITSA